MCLYTEINRGRELASALMLGHVWKTALSWVCQVKNGSFLSLILTGPTAEVSTHIRTHTYAHTQSSIITQTQFSPCGERYYIYFPPSSPALLLDVCVCMWLFMSALPLALTLTWYVKSSVSLSIAWLWAGQWLFLSPHTLCTQCLCPLSNTWRGPGMPCVCLAMVRVSLGETPVMLF